jgi:hypothetical protein
VASLDPEAAEKAVEAIGPEGVVILHPVYTYARPPPTVKGRVKILTSFPGGSGITYARKLGGDLLDMMVATIEGLQQPPLPRPKPFIVYLLEAP